jgi:hypothetical protein
VLTGPGAPCSCCTQPHVWPGSWCNWAACLGATGAGGVFVFVLGGVCAEHGVFCDVTLLDSRCLSDATHCCDTLLQCHMSQSYQAHIQYWLIHSVRLPKACAHVHKLVSLYALVGCNCGMPHSLCALHAMMSEHALVSAGLSVSISVLV